jgi:hypothetical protein
MAGAEAPKFVLFVRSVEGRAVHRWGSVNLDEMFGARRGRLTAEQKAAGEPPILWDTERVIPIDEAYARRFRGELARAIRDGDLVQVDDKAFAAWLKIAAQHEATAEAERKLEAAKTDARGGKQAKQRTAEEPTG